MIKIIRKNQKKFMAIFAVGLMVMFIKGLVPDTGQSGPTSRYVGTLAGAKVSQVEIKNFDDEWQFVRRLYVIDPNHPDAEPQQLIVNRLGAELVGRINQTLNSSQSTPLYFLLIEEARREGITISKEELQSFLTSYVRPLPAADSPERENVESAVEHCLMIQHLIERIDSVVKITRPYQQYSLARREQDLSVKFEPVIAASYLGQVPAPTDAEIHKQFDQYSDKIAGGYGQASDPLGFGYKIPDRVLVQYVGVSQGDVHAAAVASKSKEDWYVAAFGEFKSNRDDYDTRALPPSTQPAGQMGPSTQPAHSLEAAPRKVENLDDDFALHADLVLSDLYDRETEKLLSTIVKDINAQMSAGFGMYRDAVAAAGSKPLAGSSAQFVTFKFMQDLAASIRSKYGVTPILGDIAQPKTEVELSQISGIGRSVCPISGSNQDIPFARYAVELFQPLMTDAMKSSSFEAMALAPWQPSNPLEDETRNVYIFRNSGSDPAHTPAFADVRGQVIADWKNSAAYAKALEAGHVLLSSAQRLGLDAAAAEAHLSAPIVTDPFNPAAILSGNILPSITPLKLSPNAAGELASAALQLLTTPPGGNHRPQLLAELYADQIVSVIELHEAKPAWDSDNKALFTMSIMARLQQAECQSLNKEISMADAVADRMDYKPEASSTTAQSP